MPKKLKHFKFELDSRTYIFDIADNTKFDSLYNILYNRIQETYLEFSSIEVDKTKKSSLVKILATKMFEQLN